MAIRSIDTMTMRLPRESSIAIALTNKPDSFPFAGSVRTANPASHIGSSGVILIDAAPARNSCPLSLWERVRVRGFSFWDDVSLKYSPSPRPSPRGRGGKAKSNCRPSAIDGQNRAGDVRRLIRRHEDRGHADFAGQADAAHHRLAHLPLIKLFAGLGRVAHVDRAGTDRVAADVLRAKVVRHRAC